MGLITTNSPEMMSQHRSHSAPTVGRDTIRVLHVVRTLNAGGLEVGLVNLVHGLNRGGFQQAVCCLDGPGALAAQLPAEVPAWTCRSAKPARWKRHELKAASIIRQYRPQVIHARNYGAWIDAAFARTVAFGQGKLAFTMHGWDRVARMSRKRALACRWLASLTDGMAAVSSRTAFEFADETGIARSRFNVLHSGVDIERFVPRPFRPKSAQPFVVGSVARLDPVKGHSTLIEAFGRLLQSQNTVDIELRLIGDGPTRGALEQQVQQLGLTQQVKFLGTRSDLPEQLRELDLFVLASDREGRPTSIMEAMSAGLPVVATNVGCVAEMVSDGEDGFVVDAGDAAQLLRAMQTLVQHDELRAKMATAARTKAVANFSLENMYRDYGKFYEGLVSGRIGRRHASHPGSISSRQ